MMGILYKILAKAIAIRLSPLLRKHVHSSQSGFIGGVYFWYILIVQVGMEYAEKSNQNMALMQLDFNKAFHSLNWSFIHKVMLAMGFGPRMVNVIYFLGMDAKSLF